MAKTITVSIPHRLTQDEVRNRVQQGIGQLRQQFAGQVADMQEQWTGNHLEFRFGILGQAVTGRLDVEPEVAVLNVDLPWMLAALAAKIRPQIEQQGRKLLGG